MTIKSLIRCQLLTVCAVLGGIVQGYSQPSTVATTPTTPAAQVVSLYTSSQVYSDVPNVNFYEVWWSGQWTSFGDYTIPSTTSVVRGYQGLLFTGVGFENTPTNVAGCDTLHVAVYTPNGNSFAVRLVDTTGHQADVTYTTNSGVITSNTWIYLSIPLSQFVAATPNLNLHSIQQLGWIINNPNENPGADYYIDNIYFSSTTNLVFTAPPPIPAPTNNAPTPIWSAGNVQALYNSSGTYTDLPYVDFPASWSGSPQTDYTITNTGNVVLNLTALTYVGEDYYTPNQIDTTGYNTFHFDLWTADANQIGVQLVSLSPTIGPEVNIRGFATNQWVGIDVPLSYFTATNAAVDLTTVQQILWVDNAGAGPGIQDADFYIDNIYIYNKPTAATVSVQMSGSTRNLSFATQNGFNYTVQFKNNLTDATWQTLSSVSGNGSVQMIPDTTSQSKRFYRVSIQ
jgi:hypothetical protein